MEETKFFTKGKLIIIGIFLLIIGLIVGGIFLRRTILRKQYIKLENQINNAAPNYLSIEKITLKNNQYRKINISEIMRDKIITDTQTVKKVSDCNGYVIVRNQNKKNTFKTYLKCKNIYITKGYGSKETGSLNTSKTQSEKDTTKPVITLLGSSKVTIKLNSEYKDKGATAYDNIDKNITKKIKVTGNVDTSKEGTYKVVYKVSDKAGNEASKTRTVIVKENADSDSKKDTTIPVITFTSPESYQSVCIGSKVDISKTGVYGYTATDDIDGDITDKVVIEGDTGVINKEGTYTVKYSVKDNSNNLAVAERKFGVVSCSKANTTTTTPSTPSSTPNTSNNSSSSSSSSSSSTSTPATGTFTPPATNTTISVTKINANDVRLLVGGSANVNASVEPSNATNKVLNYTSSNTSVAVVDGRGTVRGLSKGSTIVKITAHNGIQKAVYVVVE